MLTVPRVKSENRLAGFDVIKGILILMVVCGHSIEIGALATDAGRTIYIFFYIFHGPAMVFLNGWFIKKENLDTRFAARKLLYYITLYLIAKGLYYGAFLLADGELPIWTMRSLWGELAAPWYMLSLAEWYLLIVVFKKSNQVALLVATCLTAIGAGFVPQIGGMLSLSRTIVFFPAFYLGHIVSKEKLLRRNVSRRNMSGIYFSLWFVVLLMTAALITTKMPQYYGVLINILYGNCDYSSALMASSIEETVPAMLGCAVLRLCGLILAFVCVAIFLISIPFDKKTGGNLWRALSHVGENSLAVYIVHFPILLFLWRYALGGLPEGIKCFTAIVIGILTAFLLSFSGLEIVLRKLQAMCNRVTDSLLECAVSMKNWHRRIK